MAVACGDTLVCCRVECTSERTNVPVNEKTSSSWLMLLATVPKSHTCVMCVSKRHTLSLRGMHSFARWLRPRHRRPSAHSATAKHTHTHTRTHARPTHSRRSRCAQKPSHVPTSPHEPTLRAKNLSLSPPLCSTPRALNGRYTYGARPTNPHNPTMTTLPTDCRFATSNTTTAARGATVSTLVC